jgi:uncharacterized membrane protein YfcA
MNWLLVLCLAFVQNVSFTMVSRSRNRDKTAYHAVCSVFSNGIWFLTMRELVVADLTIALLVPYVTGTVAGSLFGAKVSMRIERWIGARADSEETKR